VLEPAGDRHISRGCLLFTVETRHHFGQAAVAHSRLRHPQLLLDVDRRVLLLVAFSTGNEQLVQAGGGRDEGRTRP
jgi:hypothetical protein